MNDYLEFKEHLEHAFTQKDKAKEYEERGKKEANLKERRYKDTIREKALSLAKTALEYNNTYDNASPYNIGSKPYSTYGGQATAKTEVKKAGEKAKKQFDTTLKSLVALINKYPDAFFNDEKRYLEKLENENGFNRQEYVKDLIDKIQMKHFSWDRQAASHSSISHASKAGMPTNIKKDQQAQIRKEVIKRIDAYLNSSKFGNVTAEYLLKGGPEMRNKRGGGATADREMRKAANKGAAADNAAKKNAYADMVSYISNISGSASNRGLFTSYEMNLIYKLRDASYGNASNIAEKLKDSLSHSIEHSDLEHGWFTDLFKKKPTYTSTGSTAGMPSNIPVGRDTSSAAASSFTDQLAKLTNNLYQYELEERKSKEAYERYRKLVNDTKKEISRVEKLRNNAVSNSLTAVQKPIHTDKPAKYQHLPQGSKAGMPTNIPRKK